MSTHMYGIPPPRIPGATWQARYAYLMSHLGQTLRRQINLRRMDRIAWLRIYNPALLPINLRWPAA